MPSSARRQFRLGTVFTTDNRNWEFNQRPALDAIEASRSVAVDRLPRGQRLPLPHAQRHPAVRVGQAPARPAQAQQRGAAFYDASRRQHLDIAMDAIDRVRREHPAVPADIRSTDEPLFSTPTRPAELTLGASGDLTGRQVGLGCATMTIRSITLSRSSKGTHHGSSARRSAPRRCLRRRAGRIEAGDATWLDLADFFTDDVIYRSGVGPRPGLDCIREFLVDSMVGLEDWSFPIEFTAIDGDTVVIKWWQQLPGTL